MEVIRWGILGLGNIAHKFAKDLSKVNGCKLYGVASYREQVAEKFAVEFNVKKFYNNYQKLILDKEIDIIYVATLNQDHYKYSIEALSNKKAVLCEKPLAINKSQVQNLIKCSNENKSFLMEALWTRFNPTFKQLLSWLKNDMIGPIRYINASFCFNGLKRSTDSRLFNPHKAGGCLLDIGIYPLFLAYLVLGKPNDIKSNAIKTTSGVDKQIGILLSYHDAHAVLYSSFSHNEEMIARICGEKGEIYIDSRWHESPSLTLLRGEKILKSNFNFNGKGYSYEIEEVNECLRKGYLQSPLWTQKNSLDLVVLMDEIREQNKILYPMEKK